MAKRGRKASSVAKLPALRGYASFLAEIGDLLDAARRASARAVNAVMTFTYWEIGRRIVELEQAGETRAEYGAELLKRLSADLMQRFGRGFSERNLRSMRTFYQNWPIRQTLSNELPRGLRANAPAKIWQTPSAISAEAHKRFPLPWSHYVRLLAVPSQQARSFYEREAIRGGWSIRQLSRQIDSQFYE